MMRTDSPADTSMRFFAGTKFRMSRPPIIMSGDSNDPHQQHIGERLINDSPLFVQSRGTKAFPFTGKRLIAKATDCAQPGGSRESRDVLPFFVALQDLDGDLLR